MNLQVAPTLSAPLPPPATCPRCRGQLYRDTIGLHLGGGETVCCLMCGWEHYDRTPAPVSDRTRTCVDCGCGISDGATRCLSCHNVRHAQHRKWGAMAVPA